MRAFFAGIAGAIAWRLPGNAERKYRSFARAERGSQIDMQLAANLTESPARAALYLRHAGDEARHAMLFARRSSELRAAAHRAGSSPEIAADVEHLFERLGELGFLAFVHLGESLGRRQFERYREHFEARGLVEDRALFAGVISDEMRHEEYTRALLVEVAGSERAARRALRRAKRWRAWRAWRRAGRGLAGATYDVLMTLLYLTVVPVSALARLARR